MVKLLNLLLHNMVKSLHLVTHNIVKLLNLVLQNMVKLLDLVLHNMVKLLNLVLQNKSVECKSQTPSPDPKDIWVLLNIIVCLARLKVEIKQLF